MLSKKILKISELLNKKECVRVMFDHESEMIFREGRKRPVERIFPVIAA